MKFRISDFPGNFPKALENIFRNTAVFPIRNRGYRACSQESVFKKRFSTFPKGRKIPLDSVSENTKKTPKAEIRSVFRKIGRFHRILHSFSSTEKNSFKKQSTKIPETEKRKIFDENRKNADFRQISDVKSEKTGIFPTKNRFSTKPTSPTTATTENLYYK